MVILRNLTPCPPLLIFYVEIQFSNLSYLYCSSTLPEIFESDSSDQDTLEAPPPKASKSCAQHFEDMLSILCEGCLSPFDLMVKLLDGSNLKYWAYCTELYKEENQKLSEILDLVFSNGPGKNNNDGMDVATHTGGHL